MQVQHMQVGMHKVFFVLSSSLSWVNLFAFEFKIPHDLVNQNWFARLPVHRLRTVYG